MAEPVEGLSEKTAASVVAAAKELPRRPATFESLINKKIREGDVVVNTVDDDGEEIQLVLRYRAISGPAYEKLIEEHPPTPKQQKDGAIYNVDTFAPALIAAVSLEPKLTFEQAKAIYDDPKWSGGETTSLFMGALRICNAGLDVPFTVGG